MLAIYGKHKNDKRFKAFNDSNGVFVTNRIHMTIYQDHQLEDLEEYVRGLNELNPEYVFEIRKVQ